MAIVAVLVVIVVGMAVGGLVAVVRVIGAAEVAILAAVEPVETGKS